MSLFVSWKKPSWHIQDPLRGWVLDEMWGYLEALFLKTSKTLWCMFNLLNGFFFPFFWTPIVCKILVPSMRESWFVGGFYGAPVSLRTSTNLNRIGKESVDITTIEAIHFLNNIEIIEILSLIRDIFSSVHLRDTIERKSSPLIHREKYIQDHRWNNHRINKRHREKMPNIRRDNVFPSRKLEGFIPFAKFLKKDHFPFLERKTILFCESIILFSEVRIKSFDFFEDISDSRHRVII